MTCIASLKDIWSANRFNESFSTTITLSASRRNSSSPFRAASVRPSISNGRIATPIVTAPFARAARATMGAAPVPAAPPRPATTKTMSEESESRREPSWSSAEAREPAIRSLFPSSEVTPFRHPPRLRRSWRDDSILVARRDRDDLAGHLVDFCPVVLDLLHPIPREPLLDAADDRMLPTQEVAVRHEAVDQFEVIPRDADPDRVAALADRLDIRLDRIPDQLRAVPVRRAPLQERVDQLEVFFLEPQGDPLVFVHPNPSPELREQV